MHNAPLSLVLLTFVFTLFLPANALAQTNAFTYQGSLIDSGGFADGVYDFKCTLHSSLTGAGSLGSVDIAGVQVTDGLFTIEPDFGASAFSSGTDRFLQIAVRLAGDPTFTTLDPRVRLDSVPFAAHSDKAEVANFASSGPFQPIDNTPGSTSGTRVQTVVYDLVIDGSAFRQSFDIEYPIKIQRAVNISQNGISGGVFSGFQVRVTKNFNLNDQWHQHFLKATDRVDLEIDVISSNNNRTTFNFTRGVVSGYELGHDGSLTETMTINYAPNDGNPFQFADRVLRDATGVVVTQGNGPPTLGGETLLPGLLKYNYDQNNLQFVGAGSLPAEIRFFNGGVPSPNVDSASIEYLLNIHEDRTNLMWNEFTDSTFPSPLELRNSNTVIWTPGFSLALLSGWSLDRADDGGLFETYQLEYNPNIFIP